MDNKERIIILEKSFNYLDEIILNCFVEDDEKATFEKADAYIEEKLKTLKDQFDIIAIKEAKTKFHALEFEEIAELYDTISD